MARCDFTEERAVLTHPQLGKVETIVVGRKRQMRHAIRDGQGGWGGSAMDHLLLGHEHSGGNAGATAARGSEVRISMDLSAVADNVGAPANHRRGRAHGSMLVRGRPAKLRLGNGQDLGKARATEAACFGILTRHEAVQTARTMRLSPPVPCRQQCQQAFAEIDIEIVPGR